MSIAAQQGPYRTARLSGAAELRNALVSSRQDTLALFALFAAALPGLQVPFSASVNPPLWELGHIGWFQEFWLARNPERALGRLADPQAVRLQGVRADADALYNSSQVPHASRWSLPLPDADATRAELQQQLQETLSLLAGQEPQSSKNTVEAAPGDAQDEALYFFRLALHHEDMHHEAALYTAQALGIAVPDARWQAPVLPSPAAMLAIPEAACQLGVPQGGGHGFAFDNEYGTLEVAVGPLQIDAQVVRWEEYLPFVESGGAVPVPRYLRHAAAGWEQWRHGCWQILNLAEPACHLSWFEADAWCRWAGRRLPTEAEWAYAAAQGDAAFRWGDVWEWTSSSFAPFPGFVPHPYRDYSEPWFDGRPVLRGASFMTQPRMRHPHYRNFFERHRNDIPAGFRSCVSS